MLKKQTRLTIDSAGRSVKLDGKSVLKGLDFAVYQADRELRGGGDMIVPGEPERIKGEDAAGRYRGVRRSFKLDYIDSRERHWDMAHAWLEMRVYGDVFVAHARCDTEKSLASDGHFRIEIDSLPGLTGLMATYLYSDWWTRSHFDTDLATLPPRTQMLLWQMEGGGFGCIVPLVHGGGKCELNGRTGRLGADLLYHDSGRNSCDAVAFVGGFGEDPYELVRRCVARGMVLTGRPGKLRWEKPYPDIFESIGWCTWNAMYSDVNEKGILKKMEHAKAAEFPFGYVLIDDGWSPLVEKRLAGFGADPTKFPRGLRALVRELQSKYGIDHVGVWHAFTGYWRGVHPDSDVYKDNRGFILDTKRGTHIPYPEPFRSFGFWNAWHSMLEEQGIEFVKVDNQGATYHHTQGSIPIGEAGRGQQHGLQASVGLHFNQAVINCMCMAGECAWHWTASNISRSSDDFWPGNTESGCEHARQNIYNSLWYSNFCWPDWDMWWSHHELAEYHAAMRAISGGPVYVADEIDKGDYDVIRPLILSDGSLLRCDQPALPTRDCLFLDPKVNPKALKAFSRVGETGVLIALNATDGGRSVRGQVKPSDVEGIHGRLFAVREYFTGETRVMRRSEAWKFQLQSYGVRLFSIVQIEDGIGVLGLANKYVAPAAVDGVSVFEGGASIALAEGGELVAWIDKPVKRVEVGGEDCEFRQDGNWLYAQVPVDMDIDALVSW